jgi:hypothetical protein
MAGAEDPGSMHFSPILRARHLLRLAADLTAFAVINRAWWVPPLTLLLALATLLVIIGQAAAPVTLYPLF